jgi:hypothetical protein
MASAIDGSNGSGRDSSMPAYGSKTVSPTANRYTPTYAPMQQNSQQSPLQQAPQQAVQTMGLEALYQSMANQFAPISQQFNNMDQFYQQPAQQQQQMPAYGSSPSSNYRPDMSGIMGNLSRVAPAYFPSAGGDDGGGGDGGVYDGGGGDGGVGDGPGDGAGSGSGDGGGDGGGDGD